MRHLGSVDAAFLHIETPEVPMHLGFLNVMKLPPGYRGDFYEDVKQHLSGRLHLAEVFTRKLAPMPFDVADPVWIEDEHVDIDYHVRSVRLPRPGSNRQLEQFCARLHSGLLDRSRPLWELFVIEGLRDGNVAAYVKVHHAGVDGQAGVAFAQALFDEVPEGRPIDPPPAAKGEPGDRPGVQQMIGEAVGYSLRQFAKLANTTPAMVRATGAFLLPAADGNRKAGWRLLVGRRLTAPRTPFNVSITNQRTFAGRTIPMAEAKVIGKTFGASINEVYLATIAGALRAFLMRQDQLPERSLVASVPISTRQPGDTSANNQVSAMLVNLATDVPDPVQRLARIADASAEGKASADILKTALPTDLPWFGAPWFVSGMAAVYGRSRLADKLPPLANLIISNVPGVQKPLYFAGAELLCYYPLSLPMHGMALNITMQSYNGRLDYGLIACRHALPDLNELGDLLLAEHRELLRLAQESAAVLTPKVRAVTTTKKGAGKQAA